MNPAELTNEDKAAIRSIVKEHLRTSLAGDWPGWAATCSEDAVVLPPGNSGVRGREAIEEYLRSYPVLKEFDAEIQEIDGRSDLAFYWGHISQVIVVEGEEQNFRGKALGIVRKQTDGSWKVTHVMWNAS